MNFKTSFSIMSVFCHKKAAWAVLHWPKHRLRAILGALLSGLMAAGLPLTGRAQDRVFVPSFWDPHHVSARPDTGGQRVIRFVAEDDFPPFHFSTPDGTLAGFDIDLANALCAELKIICTIQMRRLDTIAAALDENKADAALAGLAPVGDIRERMDFTRPYFKLPARFAGLRDFTGRNIFPETLIQIKVGVVGASAHEAYLRKFFPSAQINVFSDQNALRNALKEQKVALIFDDGVSTSFWLAGQDSASCCSFMGGPYLEGRYFGEGLSIGVHKGNSTLRQILDYGLERLAAKRIYSEIYLKYFPISPF